MNKEENIIAQIEKVNDMLNVICKELNELETIDDYEIELNDVEYTSCGDKKPQRNYKILVTCKRNLEKEGNKMSREEEFEKVKKLIKENYDDAFCGLFDTRNIVGDYMDNIFKGKYFTLDICYGHSYFEVFGTTSEEFAILKTIYNKLEKEVE